MLLVEPPAAQRHRPSRHRRSPSGAGAHGRDGLRHARRARRRAVLRLRRTVGVRAGARAPAERGGRLRPPARRRPRADRADSRRARAAPRHDACVAPRPSPRAVGRTARRSSSTSPKQPAEARERKISTGHFHCAATRRCRRSLGSSCSRAGPWPGERPEELLFDLGLLDANDFAMEIASPRRTSRTPACATSSPTRACSSTCRCRSRCASVSARSC